MALKRWDFTANSSCMDFSGIFILLPLVHRKRLFKRRVWNFAPIVSRLRIPYFEHRSGQHYDLAAPAVEYVAYDRLERSGCVMS
ncbi:hypothetical protein KY290_000106 [Solanum tuberosum]|uniref:Uncharacterized protein n=1 Tax=Solanum tuberosum TaxID=4113 RepID=A0ABQ7WKE9_SOLTU|nr:hypothetical protein KY290_000106 [Solanum tuberosum]